MVYNFKNLGGLPDQPLCIEATSTIFMEVESSLAATAENPSETIPTANDSSEVPVSSLGHGRMHVLTTVAEIGSIQEQENQQPELSDAISKETKCTNEVCFYRFVGRQGFGPVVRLKPSMRKVQEKGRELLADKIFPLFSILCRELLTYFQLLFILFFVVKVSIIDLGLSRNEEKNTVDLVSIGIFVLFLFLSIVDNWIIIFTYRCGLLCKPCRQVSGVEEDTADDIDCGRCSLLLNYADVVRMMLNEVIVYTIIICTMFQLILNIKQDPFYGYHTVFSIISFIVAVLWKIMTTYGLSTILMFKAVVNLRRSRKDGPVASSANWFHAHVVLYAFGQIVSQIAMIVLIGVKMEYENRDFVMGSTAQVNGFLWYMLFGGVIIPLAGVFVFVIPSFYSIQEYPIGYFLDFVHSSVSIGDLEQGEQSDSDKSTVPLENINIVQNIEVEFTKIHNQSVFKKYAYVFFNPLLVVLSIVCTLLIFAFLASYLLEPNPTVPRLFEVLYSGSVGWTIFFVIFGTLVCLPHLLVLFIGVVWIVIIGFLLLFIFVVIILAFACCMCFLAGNDYGRHCAESDCCRRRRRQDSE